MFKIMTALMMKVMMGDDDDDDDSYLMQVRNKYIYMERGSDKKGPSGILAFFCVFKISKTSKISIFCMF